MDAFLTGKLGGIATVDPFEAPPRLSRSSRRRLDECLGQLLGRGVEPEVALKLGEFLWQAADQEVARIRPLALAERLGLPSEAVVAACLHGASVGLLVLLWDILCPLCRIPSGIKDTLQELRDHGHCPACNLEFELDFANSVEMIFRVHPEIRGCETGVYCAGGPAHSPHVAAQVRLGGGECLELDLALAEGSYRLRGPQLPYSLDFQVKAAAPLTRWDLHLARGPEPGLFLELRAGRQLLVLTNDHAGELVVRVERTAARRDALTAARASALAFFRELFPGEVLSAGQLVNLATVTLLVTDLEQAGDIQRPGNLYATLGDGGAFALLHEHFRQLGEWVRRNGGALVKTVGEGVLAVFGEPVPAVRLALEVQAAVAAGREPWNLPVRVGIHRGPALVATINYQLDYFGTTVNQALRLPQFIRGGEIVLTGSVAGDPQVAALIHARGRECQVLSANLPGEPEGALHRLMD
jgi:class 3 adenylate cyclase